MNTTNTCIIFDMDGTLWDASDNIAAAYNALLHEQRAGTAIARAMIARGSRNGDRRDRACAFSRS